MRTGADTHGGMFVGVDQSVPGMNLPFWAKITQFDGTKYYAWTEQYATGGTLNDLTGGRFGTTTKDPAINTNSTTMGVGTFVLLQQGYLDPILGWIFLMLNAFPSGNGALCCSSANYPFLSNLTCSGGSATPTSNTYTFSNGLYFGVGGDPTTACGSASITLVSTVTCSSGTFGKTTHTFVFVSGKLSTVDGVDKSCGQFSYPLVQSASCNIGGSLVVTSRTFTWTNGFLTAVSAPTTQTLVNCTDCCSVPAVMGPCCQGGPQNLPDTLHATIQADTFSRCHCINGLTIALVWDGSTYFVGSSPVSGPCPSSNPNIYLRFNPANCSLDIGCGSTPTYNVNISSADPYTILVCHVTASTLSWSSATSPNATPHATNLPSGCCFDSSGNTSPLLITITY